MHHRLANPVLFGSLVLFGALAAAAADVGASSTATANADTTRQSASEEVIVAAKKLKLSRLHAQLERTEDAFYAEFNKVNPNPEYETHCTLRPRYESHILERVCAPRFVAAATEAHAEWELEEMRGPKRGSDYVPNAAAAQELVSSRMVQYRTAVKEAARRDTKLAKTADDYLALSKQYEAVRKAKYQASWFVPD